MKALAPTGYNLDDPRRRKDDPQRSRYVGEKVLCGALDHLKYLFAGLARLECSGHFAERANLLAAHLQLCQGLLEVAVGALQLGGARGHTIFQLLIEPQQRICGLLALRQVADHF